MPAESRFPRTPVAAVLVLAATWSLSGLALAQDEEPGPGPALARPTVIVPHPGFDLRAQANNPSGPSLPGCTDCDAPVGLSLDFPCGASALPVSACEEWTYSESAPGVDYVTSVAASPDGQRVFVTGQLGRIGPGYDAVTAALDAAGGQEVWRASYNGPAGSSDLGRELAVSADGETVYVAATSYGGAATSWDYAVVAYEADTGALRWEARYDGPQSLIDDLQGLAVSADGTRVFVTGAVDYESGNDDFKVGTVALDASDGSLLWASFYDGPGAAQDVGFATRVSSDDSLVYVAGSSHGGSATGLDAILLAYDAATGALAWSDRYDGPAHAYDDVFALAVAGDRVFATGLSAGGAGHGPYDAATLAWDASTGQRQWTSRYDHPDSFSIIDSWETPNDIATGGDRVFITGQAAYAERQSVGGWSYRLDYATVSYDAATGAQLWQSKYDGTVHGVDTARALAVSPAADRVYVTGASFEKRQITTGTISCDNLFGTFGTFIWYDATTISYDFGGRQTWVQRLSHGPNNSDAGFDIAVSPDGDHLYVGGTTVDVPWCPPPGTADYFVAAAGTGRLTLES